MELPDKFTATDPLSGETFNFEKFGRYYRLVIEGWDYEQDRKVYAALIEYGRQMERDEDQLIRDKIAREIRRGGFC